MSARGSRAEEEEADREFGLAVNSTFFIRGAFVYRNPSKVRLAWWRFVDWCRGRHRNVRRIEKIDYENRIITYRR